MVVAYSRIKSKNPHFAYLLRPYLSVDLINGSRKVNVMGCLIDSGADHILVNSQWAKALGIDLKTGKETTTTGIVGQPSKIYLHEIDIEIPRLPGSKKTILVGFINSPNVGVLLGQIGFFDSFKITFERYKNLFEIEVRQT